MELGFGEVGHESKSFAALRMDSRAYLEGIFVIVVFVIVVFALVFIILVILVLVFLFFFVVILIVFVVAAALDPHPHAALSFLTRGRTLSAATISGDFAGNVARGDRRAIIMRTEIRLAVDPASFTSSVFSCAVAVLLDHENFRVRGDEVRRSRPGTETSAGAGRSRRSPARERVEASAIAGPVEP